MQPSEKRKFGHSGLEVTALGFGALQVGNFFQAVSDAESDDMFRTAWEAGVRYFDTAPYYGLGLSELRTGHGLRTMNRDSYVLSSKVGRMLTPARRADIDFPPWVDAAPFKFHYDLSTIWYSSINPASANCVTTLPLPMITMFGPGCCFSLRTSVAKSPFNRVVLFHETLSSVVENTNFCSMFIRSTTTGLLWAARGVGQKFAIRSYVTLPNKSWPPTLAFSETKACHSGSCLWAQLMSPLASVKYPSSDTEL
jgi:aldo/keto reductase family protein